MILTEAGRDYKDAVEAYALIAARKAKWPPADEVTRCEVMIRVWNTKHDIDAPAKLTLDAMEGVVYVKDKVVTRLLLDNGLKDAGCPRVEITIVPEGIIRFA